MRIHYVKINSAFLGYKLRNDLWNESVWMKLAAEPK